MTTNEIHDLIQNCPANEQYMGHMLGIVEHVNNTTARLENQIVSIRQVLKQMEDVLDAHSKELKSLHSVVRGLCDLHP